MKLWLNKNAEILKKWAIYFAVLFGVYMMFMHYYITSDYIPNASNGGTVAFPDLVTAMSGGRFFNYILMWFHYLLSKLGISYYNNVFVIQILGMIMYAATGTILFFLFSKYFEDKKTRLILNGAVLLCFVNPFMVETYVYGSFDWAVGIWLAVIASSTFVKKRYIWGVFLAFCAISVYQTNIVIVLIVCVGVKFLENYEKGYKKIILEFVKTGVFAGGIALLSIVLQKLVVFSGNTLSPGKEANISAGIVERMKNMLLAAVDILLDMHGMLPSKSVFFFATIIYVIAMVVLIVKVKKVEVAIVWTVLCAGIFLAPFVYGVVASTAYAPRTIIALFFSISVFVICATYILKDFGKLMHAIHIWGSCFAIVVLFCTMTCIMDCYIRQALDIDEAMCIQTEIEDYEEATGLEIEQIVAGISPQHVYCSPLLHLPYEVTYNYRIMHDEWSQGHFIRYVSGVNYAVDWMTEEEYTEYFGTQSWEVFNPSEQLYFEGDTLYWAIY